VIKFDIGKALWWDRQMAKGERGKEICKRVEWIIS
jgi:hypothetical protein